jgi:hypothetical protein
VLNPDSDRAYFGLAFSPDGQRLFLGVTDQTDGQEYKIVNTDLEGLDSQLIHTVAGGPPQNLQIDALNGKIYWLESAAIMRADLDGSNPEMVTDSVNNLSSFGIATAHSTIFIFRDIDAGSLWTTDLEGAGLQRLCRDLGENIRPRKPLGIDQHGQTLFWATEAGVHRAQFDGTLKRTVLFKQDQSPIHSFAPIPDIYGIYPGWQQDVQTCIGNQLNTLDILHFIESGGNCP